MPFTEIETTGPMLPVKESGNRLPILVNPLDEAGTLQSNLDMAGRGFLYENLPAQMYLRGRDMFRNMDTTFPDESAEAFTPRPDRVPSFEPEEGYSVLSDPQYQELPNRSDVFELVADSRSPQQTAWLLQNARDSQWSIAPDGHPAFILGRIGGGLLDPSMLVPLRWAQTPLRGAALLGSALTVEEIAKQALNPERDDRELLWVLGFGVPIGAAIGRMNEVRHMRAIEQNNLVDRVVRDTAANLTMRTTRFAEDVAARADLEQWLADMPAAQRQALEVEGGSRLEDLQGQQLRILRQLVDDGDIRPLDDMFADIQRIEAVDFEKALATAVFETALGQQDLSQAFLRRAAAASADNMAEVLTELDPALLRRLNRAVDFTGASDPATTVAGLNAAARRLLAARTPEAALQASTAARVAPVVRDILEGTTEAFRRGTSTAAQEAIDRLHLQISETADAGEIAKLRADLAAAEARQLREIEQFRALRTDQKALEAEVRLRLGENAPDNIGEAVAQALQDARLRERSPFFDEAQIAWHGHQRRRVIDEALAGDRSPYRGISEGRASSAGGGATPPPRRPHSRAFDGDPPSLTAGRLANALGLDRLVDGPLKSILQKSQSPLAKAIVEMLTEIPWYQAKNFADDAAEGSRHTRTDNAFQLTEEAAAEWSVLYSETRGFFERYLERLGSPTFASMRRGRFGRGVFDDASHPFFDILTRASARKNGAMTWDEFTEAITLYRLERGRIRRDLARAADEASGEVTPSVSALEAELKQLEDAAPKEVLDAAAGVDGFYAKYGDDLHTTDLLYEARERFIRRSLSEAEDMRFYRDIQMGTRHGLRIGETMYFRKGAGRELRDAVSDIDGIVAIREVEDFTPKQITDAMVDRLMAKGAMDEAEARGAVARLEEMWTEHRAIIERANDIRTTPEYASFKGSIEDFLREVAEGGDEVLAVPARRLVELIDTDDFQFWELLDNLLSDPGRVVSQYGTRALMGTRVSEFWDPLRELFGKAPRRFAERLAEARQDLNGPHMTAFQRRMYRLYDEAFTQEDVVKRLRNDAAEGRLRARSESHINRIWLADNIAEDMEGFIQQLMRRAQIEDEAEGIFRAPTRAEAEDFANFAAKTDETDRLNSGIFPSDEGRLFSRTPVASTVQRRRWQLNEAEFADFLELDAMGLSQIYARNTAPDIALMRIFGSTDLQEEIAAIFQDYRMLMARAGTDAERTRLLRRFETDRENILAIRDMVRGTYGLPANPTHPLSRFGRVLKHFNAMTQLTGALAAVPDLGHVVMTRGLTRTFGAAFSYLLEPGMLRMSKANANIFGEILDLLSAQRHAKISNLGDSFGLARRSERTMSQMSDFNFRFIAAMDQWNARIKTVASLAIETEFIRLLRGHFSGQGLGRNQRAKLNRAFDLNDAELMDELRLMVHERDGVVQAGQYVRAVDGKSASTMYPRAYAAYGRALAREIRRSIVTPTPGDAPRFMMTELGTILFQYKRFSVAAFQRMLVAGLQERDLNTLMGAVSMVGLGILVDRTRREQLGMPEHQNMREAVLAGVERSGVLGYVMDINNAVERVSDNRAGLSAALGVAPPYGTSARTKIGAVFGPSASSLGNIVDIGMDFGLWKLDHNMSRRATARQIVDTMPFNQVAHYSWLFNLIERGAVYPALTRANSAHRAASRRRASAQPTPDIDNTQVPVEVPQENGGNQ